MPSERLEELERVQLPHTVKMLPLRYCNEKDYQMVSAYIKELDIPRDWEGKSVALTLEGAGPPGGGVLQRKIRRRPRVRIHSL